MPGTQQIGLLFADDGGASLGERLALRGFTVTAYDVRPAARRDTRARIGTRIASLDRAATLTDLGLAAGVVVSTLDDLTTLKDACLGSSDRPGFARELRPGSIVVDLGLAVPNDARRLAGLLAPGAISVVDAAIVADRDASSATPIVLASGWPDAVLDATPVLETFGTVHVAGELGTAKALAALLSAIDAATACASEEARAIATRLGCDGELLAVLIPSRHAIGPAGPRLAAALALARGHAEVACLIAGLSAGLLGPAPAKTLETC